MDSILVYSEEIRLEGHIVDSRILPKVFDAIMDLGGDFEVLEFRIGKRKTDTSYARITIFAETRELLEKILAEVQKHGATVPLLKDAELREVEKGGVAPDGFYATTSHRTFVRIDGEWVEVKDPEMDCVIVVEGKEARCKPLHQLRKGEKVVVGFQGVRVKHPERPRESLGVFQFMGSRVSSEKPIPSLIRQVAKELWKTKRGGGRIGVVAGPAVVHAGAAEAMAKLIRMGYVDAFFSGNGLAVHDLEYTIHGTSLGVNLSTGEVVEHGHRHHLQTINLIRKLGGIRAAIEEGVVRRGIMYELLRRNVPFVLAGSIRDDGPLPEVITDVLKAQDEMRKLTRGLELVLMLCSTLHSIAVGNLLPSHVRIVCVDINPATLTKLMDRGSIQALGIVTDVGEFLPKLVEELEKLS